MFLYGSNLYLKAYISSKVHFIYEVPHITRKGLDKHKNTQNWKSPQIQNAHYVYHR